MQNAGWIRAGVSAAAGVSAVLVLGFALGASAGELRYAPLNPNFGGNSFNGTLLLQQAQIQNKYEKADQGGGTGSGGGGGGGDPGIPAINFPEFNFGSPGTTAVIISPPTQ